MRFGLEFDEPKSFDQFGNFAADYEYDKSANVAGYYFIGIYGVTTEPHIEYYIIDDWRFADTIFAKTWIALTEPRQSKPNRLDFPHKMKYIEEVFF